MSGDRLHPNMMALDNLRPTYPDHVDDFLRAKEAHTNTPIKFAQQLFQIKEKQRMYEGN